MYQSNPAFEFRIDHSYSRKNDFLGFIGEWKEVKVYGNNVNVYTLGNRQFIFGSDKRASWQHFFSITLNQFL